MKKRKFPILAALIITVLIMTACSTNSPKKPITEDDTTPEIGTTEKNDKDESAAAENEETTEQAAAENAAFGAILLCLNPEIEIEYDERGIVIELEGKNDAGRKIIAKYDDFKGKTCEQVTEELVQEIYNAGYFEAELNGNPKNIVVKLEKDSKCPSDTFIEDVAKSVYKVLLDNGAKSDTMIVDNKDLDENGLIGLDKAKELVLAQLNFTEADFTDKEYELDDGVYELEFTVDNIEYEYEVDAVTGKILKADYENNDDWDDWDDIDDDDWDDWDDIYDDDWDD